MRVLKIADINSVHVRRLATSLAARGHEVTICHFRAAAADWYEDLPNVEAVPCTLESHGLFGRKWHYIAARKMIRAVADQFAPDVVHAHYALTYGFSAALSGRRPLLVSVWGSDVMAPIRSRVFAPLLRTALRRATRVHATSEALARRAGQFTPGAIDIIPFGVDVDAFSPDPHGTSSADTPFRIVAVKALERVYDMATLIRALALVRERLPDQAVHLTIAGSGSERGHLEELARKLKVHDSLVFCGEVEHDDVPELLHQADAFANLSLRESFGVSVVEAAACGCPVVATRVGGLAEVVEDGVTGLLVPPRDPQAAADALILLIEDPEGRRKMAGAARERACRAFDWSGNVGAFESLYQECAEASP